MVEADEGEMLTLGNQHSLRSNEHVGLLLTFGELSLNTPNSKLRAPEEVVQGKFKGSPPCNTQVSKGKERKIVSKLKRDLFESLILFQLKLKQEEEAIT